MVSLRTAAFALALLGSSMVIGQASAAVPVNGMAPAAKQITADTVQQVWCGRYRCGWGWRRWGYYRPYWGYRRWGYPYGWRRCGWRRCWW